MSVSESVVKKLMSNHGYKHKKEEDISAIFKTITPKKIWLYFGRADEDGGPYFGYWVEDTVSEVNRKVLRAVLEYPMFEKNSGEVLEDGLVSYRTWNNTSNEGEAVEMIIETLQKLESQIHRILVISI